MRVRTGFAYNDTRLKVVVAQLAFHGGPKLYATRNYRGATG